MTFYHADHLGTPRMMTNATGTVVWRVETDPFGNEIGSPLKDPDGDRRPLRGWGSRRPSDPSGRGG